MSSTTEMVEFMCLWSLLDQVVLTSQEDEIRWKWTVNGSYSAKSAYRAQFFGSYCSFDNKSIWSAKVEDKHRFFAWLLVQYKLLTSDNLAARSWPCNPICPLCDQEQETVEHLVLTCVYAQEVWLRVSSWTDGVVKVPDAHQSMEIWWNVSLKGLPKKTKQSLASLLIYTAWNIWKERNRRVFEGVAVLPSRVLALIKEEIKLRQLACGDFEPSFVS
jgi:hypothetical protein